MTLWTASGLGRRFIAAVVLAVVLSMTTLAAAFMAFQVSEYSKVRIRELHATGKVISYAVAKDLKQGNAESIQQALRFAGKIEGLDSVSVTDGAGKPVASFGYSVLKDGEAAGQAVDIVSLLKNGAVSVETEVVNGGEKVGTILLVGNLTGLRQQMIAALIVTLIAASLAVAVGFAAATRLFGSVGNPIIKVAAAMRDMAERRNYATRIEAKSGDESGLLAESFNHMITEIGERDRALVRQAFVDPLTELGNRRMLISRFQDMIHEADRDKFALLLLDLDSFKMTNDVHGHAMGDKLLREVALRFRTEFPEAFAICRLGGDEFAILVRGNNPELTAENAAARVHACLYAGIGIGAIELFATTSIGIALFAGLPPESQDSDELLRRADLALYEAKKEGAGRTSFYQAKLDEELNRKSKLTADLRMAAERGELEVHFQPIVDMKKSVVSGFESLMRWKHAEKGYISPAVFIPLAEESDLIIELGNWILQESCRCASNWYKQNHRDHGISVNVSMMQLRQFDFVHIVRKTLEETALPPHLLTIEITESMFVGSSRKAITGRLEELKDMGIRLAIDDFGTGYSSLSYLRDMPISRIKIDRAFVHGVSVDAGKALLLEGIVKLCHSMRKHVVAEGAETMADVAKASELGIEFVQGYAFAKPVPLAALEEVVGTIEADLRKQNLDRLSA